MINDVAMRLALIRAKEGNFSKVKDDELKAVKSFVNRVGKALEVLYFGSYVDKTRELRIDFHSLRTNIDKECRLRGV